MLPGAGVRTPEGLALLRQRLLKLYVVVIGYVVDVVIVVVDRSSLNKCLIM